MDFKKIEVNLEITILKTEALNQLIQFKYRSTIQKSLWESLSLSEEEIEQTNLLIYLDR